MRSLKKPPSLSGWLRYSRFHSPRALCILGFAFIYLASVAAFAPQASAATLGSRGTLGMPGGRVSDPVVRQVDIARPAVVRIITTIQGSLTVHLSASVTTTFPQGGGTYPIELSGSGAFISAHGEILTADHVVNPPHDQGLNDALYQEAAQDIADYINTHFQVSQPFSANDVVADLEAGVFPSTPVYQPSTSEVYLSTDYSGPVNAARFSEVPASDRAAVDKIEAQSSFDAMDVAIIHVSGMDDMPSIQLDDSSQVEELDNLTIIGYPGLGDLSEAPTNLLTSSVNKIYVSALKTTDNGTPVIQVGGNVEHGDSGAPALDDSGKIVGIVSFGVFDPNETGQTSFLQASNSAKTLIDTQGINTTPGPLERAWSQAFDDYASTAAGHWHKAARELQALANNYKGFLGVTTYLTYAQDQASHEQSPTPVSSGPNPVPIVILVLLILLVLGVLFVVIMRRRGQPALAGVSQFPSAPGGGYPQQQAGVSGMYPSSPWPGGNGAQNYAPPASEQLSGSYPLDLAYYPSATWPGQPEKPLPQTPLPAVSETPLPVAPSQPRPAQTAGDGAVSSASTQEPQKTLAPENGLSATASHPSARELPTWAPPAQEPEPVSSEQSAASEQSAGQEHISSDAGEELPFSRPFLPDGESSPATVIAEEGARDKEAPDSPPASPRPFSVPRRPSNPLPGAQDGISPDSFPGLHVVIAPCGHTNAPDVRFCRVCGQQIATDDMQANSDGNSL